MILCIYHQPGDSDITKEHLIKSGGADCLIIYGV